MVFAGTGVGPATLAVPRGEREARDNRLLARNHHFAIKTVRRRLRAIGVSKGNIQEHLLFNAEQMKAYKIQMELLNRAQLELEDLPLEIGLIGSAFQNSAELSTRIRALESYCRHVLQEYETIAPGLTPPENQFTGALPNLRGFVNYDGDRGFKWGAAVPFEEALKAAQPGLRPSRTFGD